MELNVVFIILILIFAFIFLTDDWAMKGVILAVLAAIMYSSEPKKIYIIDKHEERIIEKEEPNYFYEEHKEGNIDDKMSYRNLYTGSQAERVKKGWLNRPQWQFYEEDMIYNDQVEWWNNRNDHLDFY